MVVNLLSLSRDGTATLMPPNRLTPIAAHDTSNMTLVNLGRGLHLSEIKSVQVVIFRGEQEDGRQRRVPCQRVGFHLYRHQGQPMVPAGDRVNLARLTFMTILLSALPVRMSYRHIVLSFPILAKTLVSD